MNYGMYLSATGALTAMHRQDVIANNLANLQTAGFKPDEVYLKSRLPERIEDPVPYVDPRLILERLGGGHFVAPTHTNFEQGPITPSGNDLDVAIRGEGFFVLDSGRGRGAQRYRFTRDGRFATNARNELVLAANGMKVLDVNSRAIRLTGEGEATIDSDGRVRQGGAEVGTIRLAAVRDTQLLRKTGDNLFVLENATEDDLTLTTGRLESGAVETSAVDPVMMLNAMINATKAAQANFKLIQYHDNLTDQSINRFGRVA